MSIIRLQRFAATMPSGWALSAFSALMLLTPPSFAQAPAGTIPGLMYEWRIMSLTGQTPINANAPLNGMFEPSINENGAVAFIGEFTGGGEGVVAASPQLAQTIVSFADPVSNRTYGPYVQINDSSQVLASDDFSNLYTGRLWLVNAPGTSKTLIKGGPALTYSAILANGGVNKNGDAVVPAINSQGTTVLVSIQGGSPVGTLPLPAGSFAFPQIADNGSILVVFGPQTASAVAPIQVWDQTFTTASIIAGSTSFSAIGNQPGISADGNVVAFYGQPNANGALLNCGVPNVTCGSNPGIFASVNTGTTWTLVRVTGFSGELGYDDNNNPLAFSAYLTTSRVAVVNLGLTGCPPAPVCTPPATPVQANSFVVSFIGTPSAASKTNPWIPGFPLLFSGTQGLWTIRVDVQYQLSSPNLQAIHPRQAIKVAQIGDTIGGNVISQVTVFDQLANAAQDDSGVIRTMRRGDHRVVFLAGTMAGQQMIVRGDHLDSDQDGLLDHWETTGIDMDQDGVVDLNLPAMGANPNVRDLFLEIDWLDDFTSSSRFQPTPGLINWNPTLQYGSSYLVSMFSGAPALTGSLYGLQSDGKAPADIRAGINLHVDGGTGMDKAGGAFSYSMGAGPLEGGFLISANDALAEVVYLGNPNNPTTSNTAPGVTSLAFQAAKYANFGSLDKDGRELAFHYAILGDYFGFITDSTNANTWSLANPASAGTNTLTSATTLPLGTGTPPSLVGDVVKITGGPAAGQFAVISAVSVNTKTLTLFPNWTALIPAGSNFVILKGNMGLAEININPGPDFNSLPGNDLIITMGGAGVGGAMNNGVLSNLCLEWRTLAHELGHTLGLRHGGNNAATPAPGAAAYMSLMSYTWAQACGSAVKSYSGSTDPTFDDWANLQGDFPDVENFLGNTLGIAFGDVLETAEQAPEQTVVDYINQNGPFNYTPPVVKVQTPAANANIGLTLPLQVVVAATDSNPVESVNVSFDVTGTGVIDSVSAKLSGTTYKASFPALSGTTGTRTITASAIDDLGNYATANESVNVIEPNPVPSLVSLVPPSATHGGKAFTLTVNGSKFVSGAVVEWNGVSHAANFVNSGQLTVKIPASDIATAGTASVTVKNPAPGGGTSNALTFTIN